MKTLLIFLLFGYNAWLVFLLLREKQQKEKSQIKDLPSLPQKTDDIVGKSLFQMKVRTPTTAILTPQAATLIESEDVTDIAVTFADRKEETPPARVPDDKLDETFTDIRISDVPQEYENETPTFGYAIGNSFEEIGKAVNVINNSVATKEERYRAKQVFLNMQGNDLFNKLTESNPERAKKITGLMDSFFSKPTSGGRQEAERLVQPQTITGVPTDISGFNIRDYV